MRARRVQGKGDDSVVKLRPVVAEELPAELRESPSFVVEVDAMPGGLRVLRLDEGRAAQGRRCATSSQGEQPLRKLFSKEQRAFYAAHAPEGIALDDLVLLGPIFVLKLKGTPAGRDRAARHRAVAVPRRLAHPRAVDEVRARTRRCRSRGEMRAFLAERGDLDGGRAADQDQDGAGVLRGARWRAIEAPAPRARPGGATP